MVKKSPRDLYKDGLSRRAKRQRWALKGPFRCPKCLAAEKLHCQTKTRTFREAYIKESGEGGMRWSRETSHLFSCRACRFHNVVVARGYPHVIDEYNAFYDRELSFAAAETQRNLIRDYSIRLLRLSKCEVAMK